MDAVVEAPARRAFPRRLWLLVPVVAFVAFLGYAVMNQKGAPKPGEAAPAFGAESLSGSDRVELSEFRGRPVVLNFWASWCAPCEDEAPLLVEAKRRYAGRVEIVGVNIRDARPDALAFAARFGLDYEHAWDPDLRIYDDYGLIGQPETFFIGADGRVFEHIPGPMNRELLFTYLDALTS